MAKYVFPLLAIILVYGCSSGRQVSQSAVKGGFDDINSQYPGELYLVRSGTGETSGEAAEAARLEIAKYFESRISGRTVLSQWAETSTRRGKTLEEKLTEISSTITVSAERDIPGIDIVQNERDGNSSWYRAWAVLSRSAYGGVLMEKIRMIDTEVDTRRKDAREDDLNKARNLAGIVSDLTVREKIRQDLTLVSSGSAPGSRNELLVAVMTSLDSLIAEGLDVGIVFTGDVDERVKAGIIQGVVDAGIRLKEHPDHISAEKERSDLVISVSHTVSFRTSRTSISSKEYTLHWCDWTLSLNAVDLSTREVIDSLALNERTSGRDQSQAHNRMALVVVESQAPMISSWVYDVIFKTGE